MGGPRPRWRLVWRDEFDGAAIDRTKWSFDRGSGFRDERGRVVPGWGNHELQCYTDRPANAFVRDGALHLRARRERRGGCDYTSARLTTRGRGRAPLFAQRYGRFEFRARAPLGAGLWPALWLLPADDHYGGWPASGEIDVMEARGDRPREVAATLQFGSAFPANVHAGRTLRLAGRGIGAWHVYGLEWSSGNLRWTVDGRVRARQQDWWSSGRARRGRGLPPRRAADRHPWPAPFDRPFHLVMNLAVGGDYPGPPGADTPFPADFEVDWVRVWQFGDS